MAKVFIAGDTHGKISAWKYLVSEAKSQGFSEIYQAGDFGYWEHEVRGVRFLDSLNELLKKYGVKGLWIDGNHENHELLCDRYGVDGPGEYPIRSNIIYLSRGTRKVIGGKTFLFMGGSVSIDRRQRVPYVSWWPQESLSQGDINVCIDPGHVDVIVSHDAPLGDYFLTKALGAANNDLYPDSYVHRKIITGVVEAVKPKLIVHGHYHIRYDDIVSYEGGRAKIIGLGFDGQGPNSWTIIDTDQIGNQ